MSNELALCGVRVRIDDEGLYCLNDLHRAAMGMGLASPTTKTPYEFQRLPTMVDFVEETYNQGFSRIITKRGKGGGTYASEIVTLRYAAYLSAAFEREVYETFQKVVRADVDLTLALVDRQTDTEAARKIAARAQGKVARLAFTDTLKEHGVTGSGFAQCTNAIYQPLLGGTKSEVAANRGLPLKANLREHMSGLELAAVMFSEELATHNIKTTNANGNRECARHSAFAASSVTKVLNEAKA